MVQTLIPFHPHLESSVSSGASFLLRTHSEGGSESGSSPKSYEGAMNVFHALHLAAALLHSSCTLL